MQYNDVPVPAPTGMTFKQFNLDEMLLLKAKLTPAAYDPSTNCLMLLPKKTSIATEPLKRVSRGSNSL